MQFTVHVDKLAEQKPVFIVFILNHSSQSVFFYHILFFLLSRNCSSSVQLKAFKVVIRNISVLVDLLTPVVTGGNCKCSLIQKQLLEQLLYQKYRRAAGVSEQPNKLITFLIKEPFSIMLWATAIWLHAAHIAISIPHNSRTQLSLLPCWEVGAVQHVPLSENEK